MTTNARIDRFRNTFSQYGIDGALISSAYNRWYLSGFTGSAGYLLITEKDAFLATDFRYVEQVGRESPDFTVEQLTGGTGWLPKLVAATGIKRLSIESQSLTVAAYAAWEKALADAGLPAKTELVSTAGVVERLRAIKDAAEIEIIQRAVDISDQAFEQVAPTIEPGVTELKVAWEMEKAMRDLGAAAMGFETIVAAGANGSLPHHRADNTVIKDGDPVVIDMGARYLGYCSDLSRTLVVGQPDEVFTRVYDKVLESQMAAEERIEAGMTGEAADAIARDIINEAGYEENFGHSLGHGVGLAVHENPRVGKRSPDVLEDGMVFSVEPGIYLSGWGGVRIEDLVVMENGRPRVMSRAHKRPRVR